MDEFIKIIPQKKIKPGTPILHPDIHNRFANALARGANIAVSGGSGVGKTFLLDCYLDVSNSVEILPSHLKSGNPYLGLIENSKRHAFVEDYSTDQLAFKALVEAVSDGTRKVTQGAFVLTCSAMCMYPNFEVIHIPRAEPERLWCLSQAPGVVEAAAKCRGNVRDFFDYVNGSDVKDFFQTSEDFVIGILSGEGEHRRINDRLTEHGHCWDMFHENCLKSKEAKVGSVSLSFSDADLFDTYMYDGYWELMPYFVNSALVIPNGNIGRIKREKITPGSSWSKHGNYCMRRNKLRSIRERNSSLGMDELLLLHSYTKYGRVEKILEYDITPQDFDTMNHLALLSKLKPRDVTSIKKKIKHEREQQQQGGD